MVDYDLKNPSLLSRRLNGQGCRPVEAGYCGCLAVYHVDGNPVLNDAGWRLRCRRLINS